MPKQVPRRAVVNPIQAAVAKWIAARPPDADDEGIEELLRGAPKRFTVYEPLVLLPSGSFTSSAWTRTLQAAGADDLLWTLILEGLSGKGGRGTLTHLAINEGIPARADEGENVRRSPDRLRMLHGDFGPADVQSPSEGDLGGAFWVETKQNGIWQTWAPRWTMFSRGNVKEKARVLGFGARRGWAVDLYAGIGYFTFSYASLGMRVLCWEINPWSVEALRRGAQRNGWSVRVVRGGDLGLPLAEVTRGEERIIVFEESNERGLARVRELRSQGLVGEIGHVNCGFLPTSEPTWRDSWEMTRGGGDEAWLHLHENVGAADVETRRQCVQRMFDGWAEEEKMEHEGERRVVKVEHVEKVKTYAPGVWHCVFDVHITRS